MKRAVFYIVSNDDGDRFVREACHSLESVRRHLPGLPAFLFLSGDTDESVGRFNKVYPLPGRREPFWYLDSTRFFVEAVKELADFDQLLYLDTDTYLAWPCSTLFDLLDQYDYAIGQSPQRDCCASVAGAPDSFCTLENGVNVFRNDEKVRRFLEEEWLARFERHWQEYDNNDNGPLRDALWENRLDLKWVTLAPEWSLRFDFGAWIQGRVRILHGRRKGISTDVRPLTSVAKAINANYKMRIWRNGRLMRWGEW